MLGIFYPADDAGIAAIDTHPTIEALLSAYHSASISFRMLGDVSVRDHGSLGGTPHVQ
jgi:hypothetical protein